MTGQRHHGGEHSHSDGSGIAMMAMMMLCCVSVALLFLLIPLVGWPIGLTIGVIGIVAMYFAHQRLMDHGGHH